MPASRIGRWFLRGVTLLVVAGVALGILPPVVGRAVPPTVMREVAVDARALVPASAPVRRAGEGVRLLRPAWSTSRTTCAPFRFTMVALTWRGGGDVEIPANLAWGRPGAFRGPVRLEADPDEGPDPGSPDDSGIQGTTPLWTGESDCVRFRLRLPAGRPLPGLKVVFLNTSGTATEPSGWDRVGDAMARAWGMVREPLASDEASAIAGQPRIFRRHRWGANEGMRRCGPYYAPKLKMAFVHHTVNSNGYSRAQADDIIRGIYAYHVRNLGWCDIAYNFLIDRFGRIWEGRYGGMARPLIGGHAQGFNTGSTGVAAIGNFQSVRPPRAVIAAYRRLLAWRLDVAHVNPAGGATMVSGGGSNTRYPKGRKVRLKAISGHRDTGYTACPGAKLYTRLPGIRKGAQQRGLPKIWNPRQQPGSAPAGSVSIRYRALLSDHLRWRIDIRDAAGDVVRTLGGAGTAIDATWNGKDRLGMAAPPGGYTATMGARDGSGRRARPATFRLSITA